MIVLWGTFLWSAINVLGLMTLACSRPLFLAFPCVFEALYVNGFTCDFCTLVCLPGTSSFEGGHCSRS